MTGFDFRSVAKAPKGAAKGKCLPAPKLAYELAVAVLRLSLDPARPPIHRETVQAVSPVLDAAYTKAQSTIPTYLGQGRSEDGLGLHRPKAGPYPVCRENAGLALIRLEQLGHPPSRVAALLGTGEDTLLAAVAALPDYDAAVAALVAFPAPPSRPAAEGGPAAEPPAERKETVKEAARRAKEEEQARVRRDAAEAEAAHRPKAEPDERHEEEMNGLVARLPDEDA